MADKDKGLPVRTQGDPDGSIQSKVVDFTTPAQGQEVDSDGNAHTEVHGNDPAGTDRVLKLSELGNANTQGDFDVTDNTKPSSNAVIVHDRNATPSEIHQNVRATGVTSGTVHAQDVAIRQSDGSIIDDANPLPVVNVEDGPGDEIADYDTATVAAEATSEHTFSVANGDTFKLLRVRGSGSSRAKWELQIGDGAASEVFATKEVQFTTEDNTNMEMDYRGAPIMVLGTANTTTIKLIRTNRDDDDALDLYSTIIGINVTP